MKDDKNKYISFRFDDGFWEGAKKVDNLLSPYKATFFIVTGWSISRDVMVTDPLNIGCNHGSEKQWKTLSDKGHDIQSHSHSHQNFRQLSTAEKQYEFNTSLDLIRCLHDGPYLFCFPFNVISLNEIETGDDYYLKGFQTLASNRPIVFNSLDNLKPDKLVCWAVRERHLALIKHQLLCQMPSNSWCILTFHSLDGEGYEPWSSSSFTQLVNFLKSNQFSILPMCELLTLHQWDRLGSNWQTHP